ncbi:MAG: nodulation protein NfeD [Candidatus Aminicenantes bacterium]|nr:nodulation protein NfeD [Candidatus Aminicenantes bacterium]
MRRSFLGLSLLAALSCGLDAAVLKITVAAPIHPITSEYIVQAVKQADADGERLVLLVLDTPGGLDTSMREIISAIVNARTPVAAYVAPSGARAASAGFFIGVACDVFAMAPGTNTGAAHPVSISITGQATDKTMEDKVTHDAASYIKTLAEKRGRNLRMAEDAVRQSLSYTEQEALRGGLINLVAATESELLAKLDGLSIRRFDGRMEVLELGGQPVVELPMTFRQKFLLTISNPNFAYLLLMLGLLGLYFEFANPGAILPGVLGGISLLLAIFSFQILPINYVGLLLILLALALFAIEIKVHSYGLLSLGGITAMVIGSLMLVKSPIPELRPGLRFIIPVVAGVSLIIIFLVTLVIRAQMRRAMTGREGMVGEVGRAFEDFTGSGKVFVHGEIWEAEVDAPLRRGEAVRVVKVLEGLKLRVTKV